MSAGLRAAGLVPFYLSDDSESDEGNEKEIANVNNRKRPKPHKSWSFKRKFSNKQEADLFIENEKIWSRSGVKNTHEGVKKYYRCNLAKARGPKCSAQLYLLFDALSEEVLLFQTDSDHDHDARKQAQGLSLRVKNEIDKLDNRKLKPRQILKELSKLKDIFCVPKSSQVRSYLNYRRRNQGEPSLSLGELEGWLCSHSNVPTEDHVTYVISHEISDEGSFRFILSTKYLLHKAANSKIIHADATFKLIWQGFRVLVIGTTDAKKAFHPLALTVAPDNAKKDFKFMFLAMQKGISTLSNGLLEYQPEVLVCNGWTPLKDAFKEVFGEFLSIRMCWTQAKRKMRENIDKLASIENHDELENDIDILHSLTSPDLFNLACILFKAKWEEEPLFIHYFDVQWLTENKGWFLGVHWGSPATNSALESHNNMIMSKQIIREKFPLSKFLKIADDMVNEWSSAGNPLARLPSIPLLTWTEAYEWAQKPKNVCEYDVNEEFNLYVLPGGGHNEIRTEMVECDDFDQVQEQFSREWEVRIPVTKDWTYGICNCPAFFSNYICKHLVGMAIRLKLTVLPPGVKIVPEGRKKGGRPSKASELLGHSII